MNKNQKEKPARIELRAKPSEKAKIQRLAARCNLPVSEYVVKRALGYAPKTVQPDVFFDFYSKLCELCNTAEIPPETESRLLLLIDEIHSELLLPEKETIKQIKSGIEVSGEWQPPDSGPLKTG